MAYPLRLLSIVAATVALTVATTTTDFYDTTSTIAYPETTTTSDTIAIDVAGNTADEASASWTQQPTPAPQPPTSSDASEDESSEAAPTTAEGPLRTTEVPDARPPVPTATHSPPRAGSTMDGDRTIEDEGREPSVSEDTYDDGLSDEDMEDEDIFSSGSLKERYLVTALKLRKQRCPGTVNGRTVGGVCLDKGECLLKKGWKAGHCALLGSCCYFEYTCGQTAHYKVSHFKSPRTYQSECELRVNIYNRDVCQIRVDFEEFQLALPERDSSPFNAEVAGAWRCMRDRFTVEAPGTGYLGFDALCGDNTGQHIYIPVNATTGSTAVRLHFSQYNRSQTVDGALLPAARWLLRITQLECAAAEYDYSNLHAALASATHSAVNKHVLAAHDADLLAPQGCLQYYPERQGEYMSFNYPDNRYIGDLHYAICFRRRPVDCGIRHTAEGQFLLDFNERDPADTETYVDRDCDTRETRDPPRHNYTGNDYLFVPNGIIEYDLSSARTTPFASKFCGLAFRTGESVTTYAPGPFFVYFHSDDLTFREFASDHGFHMRYDVLTGGCRLNDPGTSSSVMG